MLQKFQSIQVFIGSVNIRCPLSLISAIVQIQHGIHIIHTQTVSMVNLSPEAGIGDQEILNHRASVIIEQCSPERMNGLCRILFLIKRCSVKFLQTGGITRELCRCPVQDHTDPRLMQLIYQLLKIRHASKSGSRCIICICRITTCNIIQVFHHRMEFHMGKIFLCQKFHQFLSGFPFLQRCFIYRNRLFPVIKSGTLFHPVSVIPLKSTYICYHRCSLRIMLCTVPIRISL